MIPTQPSKAKEPNEPLPKNILTSKIPLLAWIVACGMVILTIWIAWSSYRHPVGTMRVSAGNEERESVARTGIIQAEKQNDHAQSDSIGLIMPDLSPSDSLQAIMRSSELHTTIPSRARQDAQTYQVAQGDSVFEIAARFNITPESVLWSNYDLLNDDPHSISVGMELHIPPVDGVIYEWQEGDSLEAIASRFEVDSEAILTWPSNQIDLVDQVITPGKLVMIPGGQREFQQWILPTIPRGRAGVSQAVYGSGACQGSYEGIFGTGGFIWPADNHTLSGNDYWSGHLGIDIAAGQGARIYAADSGVVVFAGWATGGYGIAIMIDHGNGYQSMYAHLSSVSVRCGQSVTQGNTIGYAGSTGNSTGSHLHFEIRYQGGFVNPWYVLPAP